MAPRLAALALALVLAGCASDEPGPMAAEPIGVQLVRARPELQEQKFLVKLDFESPGDVVFVASESKPRIDSKLAHTGSSSLALPAGTKSLTVKLPLMMSRSTLGKDWTLAGAFVYSKQPVTATVRYEVNGQSLAERTLALEEGKWTEAVVDLTQAPQSADGVAVGNLVFSFSQPLASTLWLDDVLLIDNHEVLVGGEQSPPGTWTISRRGFHIDVEQLEQPSRFHLTMNLIGASEEGWKCQEANAFRARFVSRDDQRTLTVYSDGRSYENGQYKPLCDQGAASAALAEEHASPAEVEVAEEFGRVDRTTSGDANNDGYNERLGAYQLVASGPRFEVTIKPRTAGLVKPVLEIAQLPPGELLVTIEGQLIDHAVRTKKGHVLIELPVKIERPTTVNVRVARREERMQKTEDRRQKE